MNCSKSLPGLLAAAAVCIAATATDVGAQARGRAGRGPSSVGRAVPRASAPRVYAPQRYYGGARRYYGNGRIVAYAPYRPYYYGYRPGLTIGFYAGYGYPYGYAGYYPYGYRSYYGGYGYGGYGYGSYGYGGYGYGPYGYPLPPPGYVSMRPGVAYGGVRIEGAPPDGQVFADGYYVGVVDDFDGTFQHMNLEAGAHKIEIRLGGQPPIEFDVNVLPGQTITFHAGIR
jgi:hypothetical protein